MRLKELGGAGTVEVLVDNEIAVQNLTRLADNKHCTIETEKRSEKEYRVTITAAKRSRKPETKKRSARFPPRRRRWSSSFPPIIWAKETTSSAKFCSRASCLPSRSRKSCRPRILFYNGGASVTCECSASLDDLRTLSKLGVEILTCGTCLNYYGLSDKLQVGEVTNMYVIAEKQMQADLILRP